MFLRIIDIVVLDLLHIFVDPNSSSTLFQPQQNAPRRSHVSDFRDLPGINELLMSAMKRTKPPENERMSPENQWLESMYISY